MRLLVAAWLALLAGARSQETSGARSQVEADSQEEWAGLRVVMAAYRQCRHGQQPLLVCLQLRALKAADRALRADRVSLLDGVELVRNSEARALQQAPALDDHVLQKDPSRLTTLLLDRLSRFLRTHSVKIDVPRFLEVDVVSENDIVQGRKKKNKNMGGLLMMMGMMKAGLMALGMKAVALLAGKALIVAKIALVLAAVLGISKLVGGGGGGGHTTYEVVKHPHVTYAQTHSSSHDFHGGGGGGGDLGGGYYETSGGGGGGHHGRSLGGGDPQSLAYRAYTDTEHTTIQK